MAILSKALDMVRLAYGGAYADNVREVKQHRIYDTRYFTAAAGNATFFAVPIGGAWRAGQKSLNETNMRTSGQLPAGEDMVITHLSAKLLIPYEQEDNAIAQYARAFIQILQSSRFTFKIANKSFESEIHGTCLMPHPVYAVGHQVANAEDSTVIGKSLSYGWWDLAPVPIPLGAQENFYVTHEVGNPVAGIATELDASSTVLNGVDATMQFVARGLSITKK